MNNETLLAILIIILLCIIVYLKLEIDFNLDFPVILLTGCILTMAYCLDSHKNKTILGGGLYKIKNRKYIKKAGKDTLIDTSLTYSIFAQDPSLDIDVLKNKLSKWQEKNAYNVHFAYGNNMRELKDKFYNQICELKNFLDGKKYFADKGQLWRNVAGDFMPKTNTSFDGLKFPCIVKPLGSYGQRGIIIIPDIDASKKIDVKDAIVSELIDDPMLWYETSDKNYAYKFHIRVYLALYAVSGITKVYLNPYARIMTAAKPYESENLTDLDIQLTGGSRTKHEHIWHIDAKNHIKRDPDLCWKNIENMCIKIGTIIGCLVEPYKESSAAYEVFGLDVMLNNNCESKLIEINDKVGYYDVETHKASTSISENMFSWQLKEIVLPHFIGRKYDTNILTTTNRQNGELIEFSEQLDKITVARLEDYTEDHKELVEIVNDELYKHLGNGNKWDLDYVNSLRNDDSHAHYIAYHKKDTDILGYVSIRPLKDNDLQLRYFVNKKHQGRGYGSAMVALAIRIFTSNILNIDKDKKIYAMIRPTNLASKRLLEKIGFMYVSDEQLHGKHEYILQKYSRSLRVIDDFPYHSKWIDSFSTMYNRLRDYDKKINKQSIEKRIYIVDRNFPDDYIKSDCLADWFTEPVRIKCKEKNHISPLAVWQDIRNKIYNKKHASELRDMIYQKSRGCNLFNTALGVALFSGFNSLLDCTAGWGDRLIAAYLAGIKVYRGFDTNYQLQAVYRQIAAEIHLTEKPIDWSIEYIPFEDCKLTQRFDAAFMSPPFYDQELYLGTLSSTTRYKNIDDWYAKFYCPMIQKAISVVDSTILMYIPEGRMLDEAKAVFNKSTFKYIGRIGFRQLYKGNGKLRDTFIWKCDKGI